MSFVRSRDLGIPFEGITGKWNGITDVPGVCVGNVTYIDEEQQVYTGITSILPHGKEIQSCFCGVSSFNGNGEVTGLAWINESGLLETPILLTNTHSVGVARDAILKWMSETQKNNPSGNDWGLPVVLETYDGTMNSALHHIQESDAFKALNIAENKGPLEMGTVGGGTGNVAYDFKAGCGTSSRVTPQGYNVGVWCQVNIGLRGEFTMRGIPVGKLVTENTVRCQGVGSLVVIIATDAPLMPCQLKRLANRCAIGMSRTGTISHNGSGDIFLAFSTANSSSLTPSRSASDIPRDFKFLPTGRTLNPLFHAVITATEEAILDSIIAQRPQGFYLTSSQLVPVLSHQTILGLLKRYKFLVDDLTP